MNTVEFRCTSCGEVFDTDKFYKVVMNGEFDCYKAVCSCGEPVRSEAEELPIMKGAQIRSSFAKRKDREYAPVVPANMHKLLNEEKELREKNGTLQVESEAAEGDD